MTTTTLLHSSRDHLMRRHFPYGVVLTGLLTRITNGADAEMLLESSDLEASGTLVQLPSFVHVEFRQAHSPNRILYPGGSTVLFTPDGIPAEIAYEIPNSLLPTVTGHLQLAPGAAGGHTLLGVIPDAAPHGHTATATVTEVTSSSALRARLRRIIADGQHARFELAAALQHYTEHAVDAAARSVYSEIVDLPDDATAVCVPAVGQVDQERIVTELLYGTDGKKDSVILRMIDRAACTDWALSKHVSRRMAQAIWGAAETHVRRSIDDPHVGRIVRALAREYGMDNPEDLLSVFREKYPTKRMGVERIRRSLEVRDLFTSSSTISAIRSGLSLAASNASTDTDEPSLLDLWVAATAEMVA